MKPVLLAVLSAALVTFQSTVDQSGRGQTAGRGGPAASAATFKPLVANPVPSRTCESLTTVSLTNTTIESATLDPGDATAGPSCRVTAVVTHPPAGDRVRIFLAFPMNDWNGRFQGVGGGGFSGGSPMAVRQPASRDSPPAQRIPVMKAQAAASRSTRMGG